MPVHREIEGGGRLENCAQIARRRSFRRRGRHVNETKEWPLEPPNEYGGSHRGGARGSSGARRCGILSRMETIDSAPMLRYRLDRFRAELRKRDYAAAVLFDLSISATRPARAIWRSGPRMLRAAARLSLPTDRSYFSSSRRRVTSRTARRSWTKSARACPGSIFSPDRGPKRRPIVWADEIESLLRQYGGKNRRLAVDRCDPLGAARLRKHGVELFDAQEPAERPA